MNKGLSGTKENYISKRILLEAEVAFEKDVLKEQIIKRATEFCNGKCNQAIKDVLGEDDYLHTVMIPTIVKRYLKLVREELMSRRVSFFAKCVEDRS